MPTRPVPPALRWCTHPGGEAREALGLGTCRAECVQARNQNELREEFLSAPRLLRSEGPALFASQARAKADVGVSPTGTKETTSEL